MAAMARSSPIAPAKATAPAAPSIINAMHSTFPSKFVYWTNKQSLISGAFPMETNEWVARCSARLHAQWPRLHREQRDEVARDLWHEPRWQQIEPEVAVVEWLRQGIPTPAGSEQR
jgi:hypothetical protein